MSCSLSLTTLLASGTFPKLRDRKETLQKSSQVFIEHVLAVAWIQFQAQDESRLPWRVWVDTKVADPPKNILSLLTADDLIVLFYHHSEQILVKHRFELSTQTRKLRLC